MKSLLVWKQLLAAGLVVSTLGFACSAKHQSIQSHLANVSQDSVVIHDLADPDILKIHNDLFILSGTGANPGFELPIYTSNDLQNFTRAAHYRPSLLDPNYDYCDLWAPDLSLKNGVMTLLFSARRIAKHGRCDPAQAEVATFSASTTVGNLNFGAPLALEQSLTHGPRTVHQRECPADGCDKAIRIDAETFQDNERTWLFYVWFDRGNNISAFVQNDPRAPIIGNAGPAMFPIGAEEELINEAPSVFHRNGKYYMFFSSGFFNSNYSMRYLMADNLAALTRSHRVHTYSEAIRNGAGKLVENQGHNTVVERHGRYYNFFHKGIFHNGTYTGRRHTYSRELRFNDDGTIRTLNLVQLELDAKPGRLFSLDLVLKSGEEVRRCVPPEVFGHHATYTFKGLCTGAEAKLVSKNEIKSFRLFWSDDQSWGKNFREFAYDGSSDHLNLK